MQSWSYIRRWQKKKEMEARHMTKSYPQKGYGTTEVSVRDCIIIIIIWYLHHVTFVQVHMSSQYRMTIFEFRAGWRALG